MSLKYELWFTPQYEVQRGEMLLQNNITVSLLLRHATVPRRHSYRLCYVRSEFTLQPQHWTATRCNVEVLKSVVQWTASSGMDCRTAGRGHRRFERHQQQCFTSHRNWNPRGCYTGDINRAILLCQINSAILLCHINHAILLCHINSAILPCRINSALLLCHINLSY